MNLRTVALVPLLGSYACGHATPEPAVPTAATADLRPAYDPATELLAAPGDYRSWHYLTSGFQMGYGPAALAAAAAGIGSYDTVFVDPASYAAFADTGVWPERTTFALEIRTAEHTGSIVTSGNYQTDRIGFEVEIKDQRIPGGWGFFAFDDPAVATKRLPGDEACYTCHAANAAVENTFTQFYPTALAIARAHGTVRDDFVGIPPSATELHDQIARSGVAAVLPSLDAAIAEWPEASIAREAALNRLGYRFVADKRLDLAIDVFAEVTRRFPDSANAYDSLAETLEAAGKKAEALAATTRGLALIDKMDPGPRKDAIAKALADRAARLR